MTDANEPTVSQDPEPVEGLTDEERARQIIDTARLQHWHIPDYVEALVEHEKAIAAVRKRMATALIILDAGATATDCEGHVRAICKAAQTLKGDDPK